MGDTLNFLDALGSVFLNTVERGLEIGDAWARDALGINPIGTGSNGTDLPDPVPTAPQAAWGTGGNAVAGVPMSLIVIGGVVVIAAVLLTRK